MTAGPSGGRPSSAGGPVPDDEGPGGDGTPVPDRSEPSAPTHENGAVIPSPRTSADADGWVGRPRPPRDLVYVDGSALSRFLEGAPERAAWAQFVADRQGELVTSVLGVTELKRVAQLLGRPARDQADAATEQVDVVRFSDQALKAASRVSAVLPPFVALHLGAALAQPDVRTVATYDTDLARVCVLHGLVVVSPGWPDRWWERVG